MEIVENNSKKMVLMNKPLLDIFGTMMLLPIFGITGFFAINQGFILQLNCQRIVQTNATNTVNCIVKEYRFWGLIPYPRQKIDQIRSAQINHANQVTLETVSKGTVPLGIIDGGQFYANVRHFVNDFNTFIAGDQVSDMPNNLMFTHDARSDAVIMLASMVSTLGFIRILNMILVTGIPLVTNGFIYNKTLGDTLEQITVDKGKHSLTWELSNSSGPIQYQLSQVKGVEIHTTRIIASRKNVFQVYLSVESIGLILIKEDCEDYEDYPVEKESVNVQAKQLAEFLGVPIERRSL